MPSEDQPSQPARRKMRKVKRRHEAFNYRFEYSDCYFMTHIPAWILLIADMVVVAVSGLIAFTYTVRLGLRKLWSVLRRLRRKSAPSSPTKKSAPFVLLRSPVAETASAAEPIPEEGGESSSIVDSDESFDSEEILFGYSTDDLALDDDAEENEADFSLQSLIPEEDEYDSSSYSSSARSSANSSAHSSRASREQLSYLASCEFSEPDLRDSGTGSEAELLNPSGYEARRAHTGMWDGENFSDEVIGVRGPEAGRRLAPRRRRRHNRSMDNSDIAAEEEIEVEIRPPSPTRDAWTQS
jgi:hypothetical protein